MKYTRQLNGQIRATEDFHLFDGRVIEDGTLGGKIASARNLAQSGNSWVFPGAEIKGGAYVSGNAIIVPVYDADRVKAVLEQINEPETLVAINEVLEHQLKTSINTVIGDEKLFRRFLNNPTALGHIFKILEKEDADIVESLVSQPGTVSDNAKVYGNAVVQGGKVSGEARVLGDVTVKNGAEVGDEAHVIGKAVVTGAGKVFGKAKVQGEAIIDGGIVKDEAVITGKSLVHGLVQDTARLSDCVYVDADSVVRGNAQVSGCVQLIRTTLETGAVVKDDHILVDEVIEDPSLATNCPEKVPQSNDECCTPREMYLTMTAIRGGELATVRMGIKDAVKAALAEEALPYRMVYCPDALPAPGSIEEIEPDCVGFVREGFAESEWVVYDDTLQLLLAAVKKALREGKIVQVVTAHESITKQSLEKAETAYQIVSCTEHAEVWRISLAAGEITESTVSGGGTGFVCFVLGEFME